MEYYLKSIIMAANIDPDIKKVMKKIGEQVRVLREEESDQPHRSE